MSVKLQNSSDFEINVSSLDTEWVRQPALHHKYASKLDALTELYYTAKDSLDRVKAFVDSEVRADPKKYGLVKVTETVVSNAVLLSKEYQEANALFSAARSERAMAQHDLNTIEQRKYALENLVSLWSRQYFSSPKDVVSEDGSVSEQLTMQRVQEKRPERISR